MNQANMKAAFDLVDPARKACELAERGLISAEAAAKLSWRDRIGAVVTEEQLTAAGVTIDDVRAAVVFYTATEPTIEAHPVRGTAWLSFLQPVPGFVVLADGYRAGPAGP